MCLRHICFFFGGGAIDRFLGRENPNRNEKDMEYIRKMVLPAMLLTALSDEDMTLIQEKVDEFMSKVFTKEKVLLDRLYNALVEHKTLTRDNIDPEILNEMRACAERSEGDYNDLLASVKEWHAEKMSQLPYFQVQ